MRAEAGFSRHLNFRLFQQYLRIAEVRACPAACDDNQSKLSTLIVSDPAEAIDRTKSPLEVPVRRALSANGSFPSLRARSAPSFGKPLKALNQAVEFDEILARRWRVWN